MLVALRSGRTLTAKEKLIYENGLATTLRKLHDDLDAAVLRAYGWSVDLSDEEILERLAALNAERRKEERDGLISWLRPEYETKSTKERKATKEERPLGQSEGKTKKPNRPSKRNPAGNRKPTTSGSGRRKRWNRRWLCEALSRRCDCVPLRFPRSPWHNIFRRLLRSGLNRSCWPSRHWA